MRTTSRTQETTLPDGGNSYPAADTSTLTLSGLPAGVDYKVMMRARYHDEQTAQHSSGPWTRRGHPARARRGAGRAHGAVRH